MEGGRDSSPSRCSDREGAKRSWKVGHLDGAADAPEVVGHVQGQHDILLQEPLGLRQAGYVCPPHAWRAVHDVPAAMSAAHEADGTELGLVFGLGSLHHMLLQQPFVPRPAHLCLSTPHAWRVVRGALQQVSSADTQKK